MAASFKNVNVLNIETDVNNRGLDIFVAYIGFLQAGYWKENNTLGHVKSPM